jgi:hypothetical protein
MFFEGWHAYPCRRLSRQAISILTAALHAQRFRLLNLGGRGKPDQGRSNGLSAKLNRNSVLGELS